MTVTNGAYMTPGQAGVGHYMAIQIVSSGAGKAAGKTGIPLASPNARRGQ